MHDQVKTTFPSFSVLFEGRVHSLYVDILGYVTVGVGNLVDPMSEALKLPFKMPDGLLASREQIAADWNEVKNDRERLKKLHWKYAAQLTKVRLSNGDIDALVQEKLAANWKFMRAKYFPACDSWPADAQLGVCSMAWAMGPGFPAKFGNFLRYAARGNWAGAKAACKIRTAGNPGVIPRNKANELCFENASLVARSGLALGVLHWPNTAEEPTQSPLFKPDPPRPPADLGPTLEELLVVADGLIDESNRDALDEARADALREMSEPEDG